MRVWELQQDFGIDRLHEAERPAPAPGPYEVLVEIGATCLNYRDILMVRGAYNPKQPLPLVPLSDGAGTVVATGDGVSRVQVGDRVAGMFAQGWIDGGPSKERLRRTLGGPLDGMLAERVVLPEHGVAKVPEHMDDVQAATLPCAALTAWSALVTHGSIKAGDVVLVQGTGGVSIFALQIAKLLGARVIATSSRDDKLARAQQLGADATINYVSEEQWGKAARGFTDGEGVDHVVEVGGAGTLGQSIRAIRPGGTISVIGVLSGGKSELDIRPVLMQNVRLQGILVGHRTGFEAMARAMTHHRLEPVVDRVFSWEEARSAFEHLASGQHLGKVCIRAPE
jgi:NADPH:quinone reductase-like Zn-dependent oxidoreductase